MRRIRWIRRSIAGLVLLIIVVAVFVVRFNVFAIKSVDVAIEKAGCIGENQIKDSSRLLGQNLFLVNSSKVENDLKQKFLCIKKVKTSRSFPNKVVLQVFGRVPAAILVVLKNEEATPSAEASSSANFVVDDEGVIYSSSIEQISAPKLYVGGLNLILGQQIKENLISSAVKILDKIKSFGMEVKDAKIYSKNLFLVSSMPKIIFILNDKIDTQIASLQLILDKAKIDDEVVEFIDLRFDKPVVKFAPKKHG